MQNIFQFCLIIAEVQFHFKVLFFFLYNVGM